MAREKQVPAMDQRQNADEASKSALNAPILAGAPTIGLRRGMLPPSSALHPIELLGLQRTVGNRATTQLIAEQRQCPTPLTRQHGHGDSRGGTLVQLTTVTAKASGGLITGITISSRSSTGYAKGQGSHNTAWVTFEDMVKLRVQKTLS